jgi:hypothetical protein
MADWRRPGERAGHVFSVPSLEMLAVTKVARSDTGDDGRTQGLELLEGDGFVDAEEAGRSEASRMTKCAMWDARHPVAPEFRRRQGSPPKDAPGPFENPMRLIGANAQLSSQNSASGI